MIYPLGLGLLVVELDWLPEGDSKGELGKKQTMPMELLCCWIYLSRLCHESEKQMGGWSFQLRDEEGRGSHQEEEGPSGLLEASFAALGSLGVVLREGRQLPLTMLADWLLHLPEESPSAPPARATRRRCHHHTAIVTDRQPTPEELKDYLFRLRRGLPSSHRPPERDVEEGWDEVVSYKENLSVGLSREGTCFILWPTEADLLAGLAASEWPRLAHGVYLLLAQQVYVPPRSFLCFFFPSPPPLSVSGRPLSSSCALPPTDRVHGSHAERWALAFLDGLALRQGSIVTSRSSGSLEQHRIQLKDLVSYGGGARTCSRTS